MNYLQSESFFIKITRIYMESQLYVGSKERENCYATQAQITKGTFWPNSFYFFIILFYLRGGKFPDITLPTSLIDEVKKCSVYLGP